MASPQIFEDLSSVFSILLQKKSEHTFLYYPLFQDYLNLLTLAAKRVLFIKDGEVFHQLYRGNLGRDEMYQKISDTLTIIATGGERHE